MQKLKFWSSRMVAREDGSGTARIEVLEKNIRI
jgi:hypothetical protein